MTCSTCHKNRAVIYITDIVKNIKKESHVCQQCATKKGIIDRLILSAHRECKAHQKVDWKILIKKCK